MNYFLPTTPRLLFPRLLSPHHNDAMRLGPAPVVQKPQVVALAPVVIVPAYQSCCWSPYCTRASPLQYHHVATLHFHSTTSKIMHHLQDPPSLHTRACCQPPALHHPNTSAGAAALAWSSSLPSLTLLGARSSTKICRLTVGEDRPLFRL
jgi:hypothetical protein